MSRCRSSTPRTGTPSTATIRSSARRPASAAGEPPTTSTTSTARSRPSAAAVRGGTRPRAAGDADPGAAHAAVAHQRRDDPPRGGVDRDREPEPDAGDRGVDADDGAAARRPARRRSCRGSARRRSGSRRRSCASSPPSRAGSERPSAETTPAVTEPAKPCGLPIATTSWPTRSRAASPSSAAGATPESVRSSARSDSESTPTTLAATSTPDVNDARTRRAAGDHVRVGEHEAVRRDHDARAGAAPADAQVRDRRPEPLGDRRHDARVRVERLGRVTCRMIVTSHLRLADSKADAHDRGEPPLVDARGDVLRAVHGDARQHRGQRRAAVDPAHASTPRCRRWSGRSTPTRCRSPCCWSPAAGSATSSAAARSS